MKYITSLALLVVLFVIGLGGFAFAHRETDVSYDIIPGQYIVVLKDSVPDADVDAVLSELEARYGLTISASYHHALKGAVVTVSTDKLDVLKHDPHVSYVSEDRVVTTLEKKESLVVADASKSSTVPNQIIPTGIARIGVGTTTVNTGGNIGVAVIDTGVYLTHPDLQANIVGGKTCVMSTRTANDDNGHGTHVSGTIAAINNGIGVLGVAPQAKIIPVKVLDKYGSGSWSTVICGLDWVTANASTYNIRVANMSLGGGGTSDNNCGNTNNDPIHQSICRLRDIGVTIVVAAGNNGADTSTTIPAAYNDSVITVSALADSDGLAGGLGSLTLYGADDTFASFSNYGSAVDIGAPGVSIYSTWKGGGYATLSGTSMATPHVSGAAALYIKSNPGSSWTQVRDALRTQGEVLGSGHTDPSGLHPEPVLKASGL
ncbi:MAG: S8 family serine peptidase [Candidatus Vogelbacteria bacterium]|nr:S8 family serine peptidase [Candidatus Vogelbacteria bacterium]